MGISIEDVKKHRTEKIVMEAVDKFFSGEEFDVNYKELHDNNKMAHISKNGSWIGEIFYDSDQVHTYIMGRDPKNVDLFEKAVDYIKNQDDKTEDRGD